MLDIAHVSEPQKGEEAKCSDPDCICNCKRNDFCTMKHTNNHRQPVKPTLSKTVEQIIGTCIMLSMVDGQNQKYDVTTEKEMNERMQASFDLHYGKAMKALSDYRQATIKELQTLLMASNKGSWNRILSQFK